MDVLTSLNLLTLFAVLGGVGFIFLLISLVVGDVFEAIGFDVDVGGDSGMDFGFFDSRVISVFITAFGGFGAIAVWSGWGVVASSLIGLLGGVIFGGVVSAFGRFLIGQQATSSVTDGDLIGRTAQVTVGIKAGEIGQISTRIGDERIDKIARSKDNEEIKVGTIVKVASISGDSVIVEVEKGYDSVIAERG
jgi:membrane protein implicated in regulation of membrane protease activity